MKVLFSLQGCFRQFLLYIMSERRLSSVICQYSTYTLDILTYQRLRALFALEFIAACAAWIDK